MRRKHVVMVACAIMAACAAAPPSTSQPLTRFESDRIDVVIRGSGPDVVLVHGLAARRDVWDGVGEKLARRYRLHLVQIKGFGGVAPGANADGPVAAPVADEIARYIRESGVDRPAVIGHSMGGSISMMLAARYPNLVGKVLVVDATPFMGVAFGSPGTTPESVRPMAAEIREGMLAPSSDASADPLERLIPGMTNKAEVRQVLLEYARASHRPTVANAFFELIVTDLRPELSAITAPMTVLYVVPPDLPISNEEFERAARGAFENAPQPHFVRIEDSGHYIQLDQPARFVAEVDAFMER